MTWKADRQAARNVARAMRFPQMRSFYTSHAAPDQSIIPAVSGDKMADLAKMFRNGDGIILYTRSDDKVDMIAFTAAEVAPTAEQLGDTTIGEIVEQMDEVDRKPFAAQSPRISLDLAA